MNYTKGEWKADKYRYVNCGNKAICFIGLRGHMEDDEDEANANLIAAAPDTHKALKDLVEYLQKYGGVTPCLEDAIKALAKAEGGRK